MLTSSRRLYALDAFRIPYLETEDHPSDGLGRIRGRNGAELVWVESAVNRRTGMSTVLGLPFIGHVADDEHVERLNDNGRWTRELPVATVDGRTIAHVWRAADGSVLLPFDPDELVLGVLSESYAAASSRSNAVQESARRIYYAIRPVLPRVGQLALRRVYARIQERRVFPRWPLETRLHEFLALLLQLVEEIAGEPLPWIAPWPAGCSWALVLTHDVERRKGYDFIDQVIDVERPHGARSAWFLVPERDYTVSDERVASLTEQGLEVGLHGLRHDGYDVGSGTFEERLPAMQEYAERWGASGFRSPSTQRIWGQMHRLGLDYDSSYLDVALYEPMPGGSCTWLPFFVGDLVELPITMPMDHTLFDLLGERDETQWTEKAASLKEHGGMALMDTHPDYLQEPGRLDAYARFVEATARDETAWKALPREVSTWWRERASTVLVRTSDGWTATGPGAERAQVRVGVPATS